jgi:2-dehydropantoate 2-reductase
VTNTRTGPILVMGAGTIGCYIGGCLQAGGAEVVFVGRSRVLGALRERGLTLSDLDGHRNHIAPESLRLSETLPVGIAPSLVLLAVKSGATAQAASQLGAALAPGTTVVSMQNGLSNAILAAAAAPGLRWLAGMVPFNVAEIGAGEFHRGTTGALAAQDDEVLRAHAGEFERAGLPLQLHADLGAVQWGKLLLNLNNPVNALSGKPLRDELMDRGYRQCLAALQTEALQLLRTAGIAPAQIGALPAHRVPTVLRLPNWLFRLIAARMLRIDAKARSSMAEDLSMGRSTEIDALCGEVVRLADSQHASAPINARMTALVKAWPAQGIAMDSGAMKIALGI